MIPQTISSIKNLQVSLLHILDSVAVPLQFSPPYFEGLFDRDLSWMPPKQLALHGPQSVHSFHIQSTRVKYHWYITSKLDLFSRLLSFATWNWLICKALQVPGHLFGLHSSSLVSDPVQFSPPLWTSVNFLRDVVRIPPPQDWLQPDQSFAQSLHTQFTKSFQRDQHVSYFIWKYFSSST